MDGGRLKGDHINDLISAAAWVILLGIIAVFDSEREVGRCGEVMMERGRSGPVRFRVGEDIDEKTDLPPGSRILAQPGSSSNVIPV